MLAVQTFVQRQLDRDLRESVIQGDKLIHQDVANRYLQFRCMRDLHACAERCGKGESGAAFVEDPKAGRGKTKICLVSIALLKKMLAERSDKAMAKQLTQPNLEFALETPQNIWRVYLDQIE